MAYYDKNDTARFSLIVTDPFNRDAAADPSTVLFKTKQGVTSTTYTYGVSSELVRDSTGRYHIDIPLTVVGTWYWRWQTSGSFAGAQEGSVVVNSSQF
tara:strand:+ start:173 stop:466 length:294 start_codon:yes stop_codon:yes gene_type:complete